MTARLLVAPTFHSRRLWSPYAGARHDLLEIRDRHGWFTEYVASREAERFFPSDWPLQAITKCAGAPKV